jgi:hypothetical protein
MLSRVRAVTACNPPNPTAIRRWSFAKVVEQHTFLPWDADQVEQDEGDHAAQAGDPVVEEAGLKKPNRSCEASRAP